MKSRTRIFHGFSLSTLLVLVASQFSLRVAEAQQGFQTGHLLQTFHSLSFAKADWDVSDADASGNITYTARANNAALLVERADGVVRNYRAPNGGGMNPDRVIVNGNTAHLSPPIDLGDPIGATTDRMFVFAFPLLQFQRDKWDDPPTLIGGCIRYKAPQTGSKVRVRFTPQWALDFTTSGENRTVTVCGKTVHLGKDIVLPAIGPGTDQ